jgi:hypothetical protein
MGCLNPIFCVSCRHRKTGPRPASHVRPFTDRFHRLIRPLLTSAVPSRRLATPVAHLSPGAGRQTSQGKTRDLRAMHLSHLRLHPPGDIGLRVSLPPRPDADASYALPVRQAGTLPTASFRSRIAPGTLAVQLAVPITRVRRGLPPPSHRSATTPTKRCSHTTRHAWRTRKNGPKKGRPLLSPHFDSNDRRVVSALALGRLGNRLALRKGFLGSGFLGHRLVLFDVFDFRNKRAAICSPRINARLCSHSTQGLF